MSNKTENNAPKGTHEDKKFAFLSSVLDKTGVFTFCFAVSVSLALVGAAIALILNLGVGLIVLGALVIISDAVAAFNTEKFKLLHNLSSSESLKLTKIGIIILVASLLLGSCSLAFGIIMRTDLEGAETEAIYTYDFSKQENIFESGVDKYCLVKVLPKTAGIYTVKIKGAELDSITNGNGKKIYPTLVTNDGEESYSLFLITNLDYFIRLHTTNEEFSIEVNNTNEPQ